MTFCSINGQLTEANSATISIQDRGFRFGDGVFESIAVHNGVPYQFEWHRKRLENGLNAIKIRYDSALLAPQCRALMHTNSFNEGILRIQVTRGNGSRGYLPALPASPPNVIIETSPFPDLSAHDRDALALWKSSYTKMSPQSLPVQYKLCQGLNSTLARMEAMENHCFDSILINDAGHVCETSSGNLFWQKGTQIYTPALSCGVLEGSTRAALLRLNPTIKEVVAPLEQLFDADAVCATNMVWKAIPVSACMPSQAIWRSNALADHFCKQLEEDKNRYCEANAAEWL